MTTAMIPPGARLADVTDHTLLRPEASCVDVDRACDEALAAGCAVVCVHPVRVSRCASRLGSARVRVCAVVGFPAGANLGEVKAIEAARAVDHGARELDVVVGLGLVRDGRWNELRDELADVVVAARGALVKVIVESAALEPDEITGTCRAAVEAGATFVKTSTGYHPAGGATEEAVALLHRLVSGRLGVKASGGIRDCATALRMLAAGATRIGASNGAAIASCFGPGSLDLADLRGVAERHRAHCRLATM